MSLSLSTESSFSAAPTEEESSASNVASKGSTPPTSVPDSDNASQSSSSDAAAAAAALKLDAINVQLETTPVAPGSRVVDDVDHPDADSSAPDAPTTTAETPAPAPAAEAKAEATSATPSQAATPAEQPDSTTRPRRARATAPIYNLSKLSGTAVHGKRRANGDSVSDKRRRTISGDTLVGPSAGSTDSLASIKHDAERLVRDGIDALDLQWSVSGLNTPRTRRQQAQPATPGSTTRVSARHASDKVQAIASKLTALGKRRRQTMEAKATEAAAKMSRELKRLRDTNEFAHIDTKPVYHTVWSNGKQVTMDSNGLVVPDKTKASASASPKKAAAKEKEKEPEEEETLALPPPKRRRVKKYLDRGLYAGQVTPTDYKEGLTTAEKRRLQQIPELRDPIPVNKALPFPMFNGLRALIKGRDYKLPFSVCNPLPPGQPKPDEWRKMTKNRFIGDSKDYWRKTPHLNDFQSKCVCTPEDGCGESCQNRIMLYECDEMNCNVGKQYCANRAFAQLADRKAGGGRYRIGVEVFKTCDRGYGVRSNRCFEPNQIITEYTGEIITEEECERRMNEKYKNNACYYLMSFDQNMIIDATTGSIARFVNHSCNPNCRMIKWIVSGNPRMALFAGDRPIMTGEELTYDYKFDPFSAKNVQSCLCGEPNCRGVLGPKPKEEKKAKEEKTNAKGKGKGKGKSTGKKADLKEALKATVKKGKRKLDELVGDEEPETGPKKKRKIASAKGLKRSLSEASLKAARGAKGAAAAVRRSVSGVSAKAKFTLSVKAKATGKSPAKTPRRAGKGSPMRPSTKSPASKALAKGKALTSKSPKATPKSVSRKSATGGVAKAKSAKKTLTARVYDTYSLNNLAAASPRRGGQMESRSSSMTIVVTGDENAQPERVSPVSKSGRVRKLTEKATELAASPKGRKALELSRGAKIRMVEADA